MRVKISQKELDCSFEPEIVCPFCGYRDRDSWESDVDEGGCEVECGNCGRSFYASAYVETSYCSTPIDGTWDGDYHEDGNKTQENEDWSNEQHYCEPEEVKK